MASRRILRGLLLVLVPVFLAAPGALGQEDQSRVTVRPQETDELLANPGIGWETFHHTAKDDRSLPTWIPSTLQYARWGWGQLEPEPGQINEAFLDQALQATHDAGQKLAFRVTCCATSVRHPDQPAWLRQVGGKELTTYYGNVGPLTVPDMDDPIVLERYLDFTRRLAARYDGHPDIDHIDIGSIGWWGEWHMWNSKSAPMPTVETQMKVLNTYFAAFKQTPLLMGIGATDQKGGVLTYAIRHGAGWRADSIGDLGYFIPVRYPNAIKKDHLEEVWKTAPVAWESAGDMRGWVKKDTSKLRYIFNYALALHGSILNNKSAPLPQAPEVRTEIERFLRQLGYRLVLKELSHPAQASAGGKLELAMQWQNVGSAPCYRPYRLAYRLATGPGYEKVFTSAITVNHWLPGSIELFTPEFFKEVPDLPPGAIVSVSDTITLPNSLVPGTYTLALGVVESTEAKPVVRLGIKGRAEDGWYPLSQIQVTRP